VLGQGASTQSNGDYNIAIGYAAYKASTGDHNVVIGDNAGDSMTGGSGNVVIGSVINPPSLSGSNQIAIGTNGHTVYGGDSAGNPILNNGATCAAGTVSLSTLAVTNGVVTHC
jgi:hypothetical protein